MRRTASCRSPTLGTAACTSHLGEQERRLTLFCAAYPCTDGATLVSTVVKYLAALRDLIRSRAVTGDPAFAAMLADGHDLAYDADLRHVTRHQARFVAAVAR